MCTAIFQTFRQQKFFFGFFITKEELPETASTSEQPENYK